jgi:hypothetical protein
MPSNFENDRNPRQRAMTLSFLVPADLMSAAMTCAGKEFTNISSVARAALAEAMRRKGYYDDEDTTPRQRASSVRSS